MKNFNYVDWHTIVNTMSRDEFNSYWRYHSGTEVTKKFGISKKGLISILKYWDIPKKTYEERSFLSKRGGLGRTPWNKGLRKGDDPRLTNWITEDILKRKSLSMLGKNKGKIHSEESRKHMSEGWKKYYENGNKKPPITQESRMRMIAAQNDPKIKEKIYNIKKVNNSFNTSSNEEVYYKKLLKTYEENDIIRQYKDKRYPFNCDFYIKSEDKFIELNIHWTHGGHPFDETNEDDIKKLNEWKEKAKTSKFYKNAIHTWTIRDVEKFTYIKNNNLNMEVIYE